MRNIPNLRILVGANGVGKSTSISVFDFLKCLDVRNLRTTASAIGGCQ